MLLPGFKLPQKSETQFYLRGLPLNGRRTLEIAIGKRTSLRLGGMVPPGFDYEIRYGAASMKECNRDAIYVQDMDAGKFSFSVSIRRASPETSADVLSSEVVLESVVTPSLVWLESCRTGFASFGA